MKLSRLSNRQLRRLLAQGEVRFSYEPDKTAIYKSWIDGAVKQSISALSGEIVSDRSFKLYEISPDVQRKIKAQIAKIINELKKLPGVIK